MDYDLINGETHEESITFCTISDLLDLARKNLDLNFIFLGTNYSPKEITSWRGSYCLPAVSFSSEQINGKELAKVLKKGLNAIHNGYKGGAYQYFGSDVFYIANYGEASEYKVIGYEIIDNEVVLLTKIDKY